MVGPFMTLAVLVDFFAVQEYFLSAGADCRLEWGVYYPEGQEIHPGGPNCLYVKCKDRIWEPIREGCLWNRKCHKVGASVEDSRCISHTCIKSNGIDVPDYNMEETSARCVWNGKCHDVGASVEDIRCISHTCRKSKVKGVDVYTFVETSARCVWNGKCHDVGASVEDSCCISHTCRKSKVEGVDVYTFVKTSARCAWNDRCYDVGATVEDNTECKTHTCTKSVKDGVVVYEMRTQTIGCKHNDTCFDLGEIVTHKDCQNFTCARFYMWQKTLVSYGPCCLRGQLFNHNEIIRPPGITNKCNDVYCLHGMVIESIEMCEYKGECYRLGHIITEGCKKFVCKIIPMAVGDDYQFIQDNTTSASGRTQLPSSSRTHFGPCCVRGKLFNDKHIFTPPGVSNCVIYRCSKGNVIYVKERCEHNNACYDLGATIEHDCKNHTCIKVPALEDYSYRWHATMRTCLN